MFISIFSNKFLHSGFVFVFLKHLFFKYMSIPECLQVHRVHTRATRTQKRALDPYETEAMVLNHFVGAGNLTHVLCQSGKCSWLLSHLFSPLYSFCLCLRASGSQIQSLIHTTQTLPLSWSLNINKFSIAIAQIYGII